jgi:hypothetical protein
MGGSIGTQAHANNFTGVGVNGPRGVRMDPGDKRAALPCGDFLRPATSLATL